MGVKVLEQEQEQGSRPTAKATKERGMQQRGIRNTQMQSETKNVSANLLRTKDDGVQENGSRVEACCGCACVCLHARFV